MIVTKAKEVFMIRRPDGLFSTGGTSPRFSAKGKAWASMGALKNHLNQFVDYHGQARNPYPPGTEVVVLKLITTTDESSTGDKVEDFINDIIARLVKEQVEYERKCQINKEVEERKKLAELKAKYDS